MADKTARKAGWRRGCSLALAPRSNKDQGSKIRNRPPHPNNRELITNNRPRPARVRPDFVFPGLRVAVFVDGCFWHGCPRHATWPKTRAAFWKAKIEGNRSRDRRVDRALRRLGWQVLRIWEHALTRQAEARTLRRLRTRLVARRRDRIR